MRMLRAGWSCSLFFCHNVYCTNSASLRVRSWMWPRVPRCVWLAGGKRAGAASYSTVNRPTTSQSSSVARTAINEKYTFI